MNVNRLLGILAVLLLTAASALYAQKPVKVKGVQGRWQVSDDITLKQAEERAFMEAKKAALQKAGVMENVWSVFGHYPGRRTGAPRSLFANECACYRRNGEYY